MDIPNSKILETVESIRHKLDENKPIEEIKKEFSNFVERYPTLFQMATKQSFNINELKRMLDMKSKMDRGEETLRTSSEKISTEFFQKYHK